MPKLNVDIARKFRQALIDLGYKDSQLRMMMAQAAHETAGFNHKRAIENNNFGGIKFQRSLSKIAIPSANYFAPRKEGGGPYAHFNGIPDFVRRWIPYAHLNGKRFENKLGAPLDARDLKDYAHRLKLNHYYQDNEENYLKGLTRWNSVLESTFAHNNSADDRSSGSASPQRILQELLPPEFSRFNNWPLAGILSNQRAIQRPESRLRVQQAKGDGRPLNMVPQTLHEKTPDTVKQNDGSAYPGAFSMPDQVDNTFKTLSWRVDIRKSPVVNSGKANANKSLSNQTPLLPDTVLSRISSRSSPTLKNEIAILPLSPDLTNIWSSPLQDVIPEFPKDDVPLLKPLELLDTANAAGNLKDDLRRKAIIDTVQKKGPIPTPNPYMKNDRNTEFQIEGPKAGKQDVPFLDSSESRDAVRENYRRRDASGRSSHGEKAVNINLESLVGSFTIITTSAASGIDDLKSKVEEALLEIVESTNSNQ